MNEERTDCDYDKRNYPLSFVKLIFLNGVIEV